MNSAPDNFYPCLLDRIVGPGKRRPGFDELGIQPKEYRNIILRDLKWLLNSLQFPHLERCLPWHPPKEETLHSCDDQARTDENPQGYLYPNVRRSVLNYGIRSLAGALTEGLNPMTLAREVREAIINFEPRFIPRTVSVETVPDGLEAGRLAFIVKAQLWSLGGPIPVFFRSDHDLETGDCHVTEQA